MRLAKLGILALAALFLTPAGNAQSGEVNDKATLFFYRLRHSYGSLQKPSVFCDSKQIARMRNGRFFKFEVAPGEHTITSTFAGSGATLTLKRGETYYFRVDLTPTMTHNYQGQITEVGQGQGKFEVSTLKPTEDEDLKIDGAETGKTK